jgi:TfoX/Sxy family transcriptional regulator of competence genes
MAYDEYLNDRIRQTLAGRGIGFIEKKMMGGVCYLVGEKMCVGIVKNSLMVRMDPEKTAEAIQRPGCREMDFTKKPLKGFVFIEPEGTDLDRDLEYWSGLALEFNPKAKKSGKK